MGAGLLSLPVGPYPEVALLIGRLVVSQFTQAVLDPANNTPTPTSSCWSWRTQ